MKKPTFHQKNKNGSSGIKRRAFLGMGLTGVAGVSFPTIATSNHKAGIPPDPERPRYWSRTERFGEKVALLQKAWEQKNYRMVRALTDSLRNSALQAQAEESSPGTPVLDAAAYAELPLYPSDLITTGEGFGLSLENEFYKVHLSKQTGQIERLILKREHGMEYYSGGQGHGEPAGIDWAHDYTPPTLHYQWHGQLWSRYPVRDVQLKEGTTLYEKNAYSVAPFFPDGGAEDIEALRKKLLTPLVVSAGKLKNSDVVTASGKLARPGDTDGMPVSKKLVWEALQIVKDPQLYTADVSIVDLGLVRDVRVRGEVVTIVLAMPHRGRPLGSYFDYGSNAVHSTLT